MLFYILFVINTIKQHIYCLHYFTMYICTYNIYICFAYIYIYYVILSYYIYYIILYCIVLLYYIILYIYICMCIYNTAYTHIFKHVTEKLRKKLCNKSYIKLTLINFSSYQKFNLSADKVNFMVALRIAIF